MEYRHLARPGVGISMPKRGSGEVATSRSVTDFQGVDMAKHTRTPNVLKYERFAALPTTWARMVNNTDFAGPNGCWNWTGAVNTGGYGVITHREVGNALAHRLALHIVGRPVPESLTVDHLCFNTRCVNPAHLESVTARENVLRGITNYYAVNARKTHCVHGHEFDEANTRIYFVHRKSNGHAGWVRSCAACGRASYQRKRVATAA